MQTNYDNNLPDFMDGDCCSPPQLLQNHHHYYSHHHHHHQDHGEEAHHNLHYYPHQPVQPWQYRAEQETVLKLSYQSQQVPQLLNFKLGLNENCTATTTTTSTTASANNALHQFHHLYFPEKQTHFVESTKPKYRRQPQEYSISNEPFCFADDNSKDNYSLNELDAVYNLAKIGDNSIPCEGGAAIDGATSIGEEGLLMRKLKKKKRKRRIRKEVILLSSMTRFFKGLVEKIVSHQDRLHENFLESMDRMEKERMKREEAWKREEARWHNREAIAKVHEQAQALNREEVIVSHIENITGQRVNFPI
ncbi:trihelix transcription factor GT-2-like [Humulus lupulus]|uniref:trihelix transcription factor GT-2-like n=1 Tax=Humulus lupulus TaxID=3486 RepID=UPI002B40B1EC|nr:trihelix transcription factor GT-2-like [Humulus lupulus]